MVGDTILINDISINGNDELKKASDLSKELTDNTINALGIDASSRTIWINGQPYGNAYVNVKTDGTIEKPIGGEIFNDFTNNVASGEFSHAEGKGTVANNEAEHAEGKYNKSNNTIHSVGIGTSDNDRKNAEEIHYDSGDKYVIGIGGYDGTNSTNTTVKTVQKVVNESINQITISYLKLKELRDASQLVPGQQYRINDYTCTTTQIGTTSAGNVFDIIVRADSESTLNEEARVINRTFANPEQDHFKDCNLSMWKIWYCLDNDRERFAWADNSVNGKGVIYRMIDEFNNDCPYDFKNIQFYRKQDPNTNLWSITSPPNITDGFVPCYTFSSVGNEFTTSNDESLHKNNQVYSNVIKAYVLNSDDGFYIQNLNNICLFGGECYNNTFERDCAFNTLDYSCCSNTFGNNCSNNKLVDYCQKNTFGSYCSGNVFRFGSSRNSLGNNCNGNNFGEQCSNNTFGDGCSNNTFGNDCSSNLFGNGCTDIKFASYSVDSSSTKYDYYKRNHFGDGCQYIVFKQDKDTDPRNPKYMQNYNFAQGLQGDKNNYLYIDGKRGRAYDAYISLNTDGALKESVIADKLDKMIEITYKKLYDLRESSGLIPGQQYRITDYICTTNPADTSIRAQQNKFDIIVTADNESVLNEEARAIRNDNDNNYFKDCDLNSWKLWYSLDNDTTRFAWADATETDGNPNGKGVIYRMIDEFGNDCPYDFKNIQFKRYAVTNIKSTKLTNDALINLKNILVKNNNGGLYFATKDTYGHFVPSDADGASYEINENDSNWYYTFQGISSNDGSTINKMYDLTVETFKLTNECISYLENNRSGTDTEDYCRENKIEQLNQEHFVNDIYYKGRQILNNIVFIGGLNYCYQNGDSWEYKTSSICGNRFGVDCNSNTFGNYCQYNTFGNRFQANTFGNYFRYNTFGKICGSNTFGNNCLNNTFGNECHHNTHGNNCDSNTFGNYYYNNTLGNRCNYNTFGENCNSNSFGENCNSNSFGNDCFSNTFGDSCNNNTAGNSFQGNTFGDSCSDNSFGNYCHNIKFGPDVHTTSKYGYYQQNHFGDGCRFIVFKQDKDPNITNFKYVQNYIFAPGFNNHTINGERGREYDTYISLDSDEIKRESVIADKLDKMIEITYKELYDLREANGLIPGQQYRIIDYTCTTIQENTRSAGHDFDIIVTADSKNKLNEEARAIQHTDLYNDYFYKCNLSAWKIWYSLDNDKDRFAWAGATNGKGVIYRMIDEFNNDIPYDFKNIQFKYPNDTETYTYYYYTFASDNTENNNDYSLDKSNECHSNTIKPYINIAVTGKQMKLNRIMFIGGRGIVRNTFGNNCYGNAFNYACSNNTFGDRCSYNIFGTDCSSNVFGNGCSYNIFRNDCSSNNFGNGCSYNIFDTEYFYFNNIDNWVKYVHVTANPATTNSKHATNYHITSSVKGIDSTTAGRQPILVSPGRSYITTVDMDSGGTVKYYCVADLLNNWEPLQSK